MSRPSRITCLAACLLLALGFSLPAQESGTDSPASRLVKAARKWVGKPIRYDGGYRKIAYPGGDPGEDVGVCTDLVVRSYRAIGIDLQVLVHRDMRKNFRAYPARRRYGQTRPDTNIDHRRVTNLKTFFSRHGESLTLSLEPNQADHAVAWQPGDIVVFDLFNNGRPTHIGIVSDRKTAAGMPFVIHHYPPFPSEDDCLRTWKIVGHFRYFP